MQLSLECIDFIYYIHIPSKRITKFYSNVSFSLKNLRAYELKVTSLFRIHLFARSSVFLMVECPSLASLLLWQWGWKITSEGRRTYFIIHFATDPWGRSKQELKVGIQRQELKQKAWKKNGKKQKTKTCFLACFPRLIQLSLLNNSSPTT